MHYLSSRRVDDFAVSLALFFGLAACSGRNELSLGQVMPGPGGAGGGAGNAGWIAPDSGLSDWSVSQDGPCNATPTPTTQADLALYVVLDRSSDMQSQQNNGDWFNLLGALGHYLSFGANPAIQWGLSFYPMPCSSRPMPRPGCPMSGMVCDLINNSDPYWPLGSPGSLSDPLNLIPTPGGSPVLRIAVDGAFGYLKSLKQSSTHGNQLVVPLIIAGGQPDGSSCSPNNSTDVADSLSQPAPQTKSFVIAYDNSNNQLDNIARAGGAGTPSALFLGAGDQTETQLEEAISTITERSCAAVIPPGTDPRQINVQLLTPDAGIADNEFVGQVRDHSQCSLLTRGSSKQLQWYYDDPQSPKLVIGCDYTCTVLHTTPNASLQILTGCQTVSIPGIR